MDIKRILFVIDELEYKWFEFNKLVTNFWFIKELLERGFEVDITTKNKLYIENYKGCALCNKAELVPPKENANYTHMGDEGWRSEQNPEIIFDKAISAEIIESYDAVFFRPDPPVDVDYINACSVFEFVNREKTVLLNDPLAVRTFNEKMSVNHFPGLVPRNITTASKDIIIEFVNTCEKAVIKPLNRCFGSGVFILQKNDPNLSSIIGAATENGKTMVMVQEYLPGAVKGDKRVLIIGEKVLDECVRKLPAKNDFKFAEHSDSYFEKAPLTSAEKQAAKAIAKELNAKGIYLVGLDMIDEKVIEINVTSPCYFIKEINSLYQTNFQDKVMQEICGLILQKAENKSLSHSL